MLVRLRREVEPNHPIKHGVLLQLWHSLKCHEGRCNLHSTQCLLSPLPEVQTAKIKVQKAMNPHPLYLAPEEDPVSLLPHVCLDGMPRKNGLSEASLVGECVCVCVCVCVHVLVCVYMNVCMDMHMQLVCIVYVRTVMCMHVYDMHMQYALHVHAHVYDVYACVYGCVCTHMCMRPVYATKVQ